MPDHQVIIVGAGFAGIGAAIALDRAGIHDVRLIEAGAEPGGTWYWNRYPGIGVDIPSFAYQFSFAQSRTWSRTYAPGHEVLDYARRCVDEYGLRSRIRLGTQVLDAAYDDAQQSWRLRLDTGEELTCRYLVNATGVLTVPNVPDIPGVDSFGGATMHTARWDDSVDLTGKRVAVIGTGASAVQVIPELAPIVAQLTVFQRTPIWCFPKFDVPLSAPARLAMRLAGARSVQRLVSQAYVELTFTLPAQYFTVNPLAGRMAGAGRAYLRMQVHDPVLREKLTPAYAVGCKRPGFHNTYLSTFNRDNVALVTEPIDKITGSGVATTDGAVHDADVLILATGFKVADFDAQPVTVTGAQGVSLADYWRTNRLQAYEGVSVPGFPNLFSVAGPYGYVGNSYFMLIETQTRHIVRCLTEAGRRGARRVEISRAANDRYFAEMMRKRHRQIFWQDSCRFARSYYFDRNGDVPLRPASTPETMWRARRFPLDDYVYS
jgi:cation diffusion facilitator CzcD-associated flavoprotein CzcO